MLGVRELGSGGHLGLTRGHLAQGDPAHPGRLFTPNEKYAALVEACGYVPVALEGDDYIELLPAEWRAVNDYGIRIKNRTYNSADLGPMRRHHSGVMAKRGLWEIHRDPYDVSRIWVRNHCGRGDWVPAVWKHLKRVPVPFGELAWDHEARKLPGATEAEIADAVAALLTRAHAGPGRSRTGKAAKKDGGVAARTKVARPSTPLPPAIPEPEPANEAAPERPAESEELAEVIPLGLFDPLENPWRRS
ncbi:Mu transposase C-terminal domain-containing protein [Streptomyces mirabilis]|uniref:Mu transposase C-terminal domain-containing protein n=1 Tax=Streptomyces mirabilis TaxID=68239 RepID=UPI0036C5AF5F